MNSDPTPYECCRCGYTLERRAKIIASSMKHNIEDLNRQILDILQADSAFMRQLDVGLL